MGLMGKRTIWMRSIITLCMFTMLFINVPEAYAEDDGELAAALRLYEVHQYIENYHVSGVDGDVLADEAIRAMVQLLDDPHTVYYTKEEYDSFTSSIEQNYVGIGIRVSEDEYGFIAVEVFSDSPAQAAGLMEGDYIITVDGKAAADWDLEQLVDHIKGPENSTVELTIERFGEKMTLQVKRKPIQVPLVTTKWFTPGIGYIQFSSFSAQAEKDFALQLADLKHKQMKGLILDLRGNPGGYLHVAEKLAKHFIPEGTLLYTRDRSRTLEPMRMSGGSQVDVPIAILVNEASASASEIFSGALRDHEKAILIGTKTYGKGSVQQIVELSDGSYLKLTIEQYLTPKQIDVDGVGLEPDIEVHGALAQFLTAFQYMNPDRIEIKWDEGNWTLNDVSMSWVFPTWNNEETLYVPVRIAAALSGHDVKWNGEQKEIILSSNDAKRSSISFQIGSDGVELLHGTTYVSFDRLEETFPSWQFIQEEPSRFQLRVVQ